jgi:serine/threonine-protein kinase
VLKTEPEWSALPDGAPASIRRLLRRCLAKNPHDRVHDAADARIVLVETLSGDGDESLERAPAPAGRAGGLLTVAALVVAVLAVAYAVFLAPRSAPSPSPNVRFQVAAETLDFSMGALPFALSPDGKVLAYMDYDGPGTKLFLRRMDHFDVQTLSGTEGAGAPFFSPDGEWIGFYAYGTLKKIALAGGKPIDLCPTRPAGLPGLRTARSSIRWRSLRRVCTASRPTEASPNSSVLFSVAKLAGKQAAVLSLDTGEYSLLSGIQGRARYVPGGRLVYGAAGSMLVVPFDAARGETTGPPIAVLEDVGIFMGGASFAVSQAGALAYLPEITMDYVWVDRSGAITPIGIDDATGSRPILSHDGNRLAIAGGTSARGHNLHIYDLKRGGRIRLPGFAHVMWSSDDTEVFPLIRTTGASDIYRMRADGSGEPELIFESENNSVVTSVSSDMQWLLFYEQHPETSRDIWAVKLDGSGDAVPILETPASERAATFSPEGQWFAYASNASGRDEVYVRRFDPTRRSTAEHLVSTNGGREPQWSRDGKELSAWAAR